MDRADPPSPRPHPGPRRPGNFPATPWSILRQAALEGNPGSRRALERLCGAYWYPLYVFARRDGANADDAQDLVQGFFSAFLERNYLKTVRPEDGKFRSYLLKSLKNYRSKEDARRRAQRRGGGRPTVSLDFDWSAGERRYRHEPSDEVTPHTLFERGWAITVLGNAVDGLRRRYEAAGNQGLYEAMRPFLPGSTASPSYEDVASSLGMQVNAVKVAVHRLRRRYAEHLRAEVGKTVAETSTIDDEIRELLRIVSGGRTGL